MHSSLGRHDLLEIAQALTASASSRRVLVAIDGIDGAGKTTLASELSSRVNALGFPVVLIHVDDFMNLRHVRHRRGRNSPVGYFLDSYDYEALETCALQPLSPCGSGEYQAGITDRHRDARLEFPVLSAPEHAVVIVEGLFLLRDDLIGWWDYSIFITIDGPTALQRKAVRDGLTVDEDSALGRRYRDGQKLYLDSCRPAERATWLIGADAEPSEQPGKSVD